MRINRILNSQTHAGTIQYAQEGADLQGHWKERTPHKPSLFHFTFPDFKKKFLLGLI